MIGIIGCGLDSVMAARAVREKMPDADVLCLADNRHLNPASAMGPEEWSDPAVRAAGFLAERGARLILIASHTVSAVAGAAVSARSAVPVLDIIAPTVQLAVRSSRYRRIGIIGSRTVIESRRYPDAVRELCPEAGIYDAAAPLLLPLIEEGWLKRPVTVMIVKRCLIPLKIRQMDTLILASTPFALLEPVIRRKAGKRVAVVEGCAALSQAAADHLDSCGKDAGQTGKAGRMQVMLTGPSAFLEKQARTLLNCRQVEQVRLR